MNGAARIAMLVCLLGSLATACRSGSEGVALSDYTFATGTFAFEVDSEMEATYDLSRLAEALSGTPQGVEGGAPLAAAGPTTTSSNVSGVAEVTIAADGDNRKTTVRFTEASGEMTGAFGSSEIGAADIGTAEFVSTPDGKVVSGRGGRTAGLPSLDIGRAFNCPPLPDGGVTGETSWETEVTLDVAGGVEAVVPTSATYTEDVVEVAETGTVEGRMTGSVETSMDSSVLTAQLQLPQGGETAGVSLDVLVEMDVTVSCSRRQREEAPLQVRRGVHGPHVHAAPGRVRDTGGRYCCAVRRSAGGERGIDALAGARAGLRSWWRSGLA